MKGNYFRASTRYYGESQINGEVAKIPESFFKDRSQCQGVRAAKTSQSDYVFIPSVPQDTAPDQLEQIHGTSQCSEKRDKVRVGLPHQDLDYESDHGPKFEYKIFSQGREIRILTLLPAEQPGSLCCTLEHQFVDHMEPYEALSYAWGKDKISVSIFSQGRFYSLMIPRNLHNALCVLRNPSKPRILWADAICINQENNAEKGHQVRLMRDIFRNSRNVLIWLGTDESHLAEELFQFSREIRAQDVNNGLPEEQMIRHIRAFSALFDLSWFWRIWCLQEVILAPSADVMWGDAKIGWDDLGYTAQWIRCVGFGLLQELPGVYNASLMYSLSRGSLFYERKSFIHMMMLTRQFEASKDEDRVYALLGIPTTDADPGNGKFYMTPDYEKTKDVLYEDLARKCVGTATNLTALSAVEHGPNIPNTKTWVPQWDKHYSRSIISVGYSVKGFSASKNLHKQPSRFAGSHLIVYGSQVDAVRRVSDIMPTRNIFVHDLRRVQHVWNDFVAPLQTYPDGSNLAFAFCWTISAGKDWYGKLLDGASEARHLADFTAFVRQNFDAGSGSVKSQIQNLSALATLSQSDIFIEEGVVSRFLEALYPAMTNRRFFITQNGHIGIGPACIHEGDAIGVISGATVPFVLRKSGQDHLLAGEAYVHGIMHGEASERSSDGIASLTEFRLR